MSRSVLTGRLAELVDADLLRREPYQERPTRYDYLPTEKALELWPALVALAGWGSRHATPDGPPREFFHEACGTTVEAAVHCPHCDVNITARGRGQPARPGLPGGPVAPRRARRGPRPPQAAARRRPHRPRRSSMDPRSSD